jgi:uncharacterized protein YdhG (YjbR/CyaY superfamily)
MKKAQVKSKKRNAASKGGAASKNVEQYVAGIPESARPRFDELHATIRSAVPPEAIETISYGIPAFETNRVLVWFAAFANHCSLFPTAAVIEQFKNELQSFRVSKGTIHFPLDRPLPTTLIKKIVKARVAQNKAKK